MSRKSDGQDVTNAILGQQLTTLTSTVETLARTVELGFSGIHQRQDKTNGNVNRHDLEISELRQMIQPLVKVVYGFVGLALTAVAGSLIALVLKH